MTKQKFLFRAPRKKINQTLMKSNSCSWILIENSWLVLWLNFSFSRITAGKFIFFAFLLFVKGEKNNRATKSFSSGRKFVNYLKPTLFDFLLLFADETEWKIYVKAKEGENLNYIKEIEQNFHYLPFNFPSNCYFHSSTLSKYLLFISIPDWCSKSDTIC